MTLSLVNDPQPTGSRKEAIKMKPLTDERNAVENYLQSVFGGWCVGGNGTVAPPPLVPFEVTEPLETDVLDVSRNTEHGLTPDCCIPPGIYAGLTQFGLDGGICWCVGNIIGSPNHGTRDVKIILKNWKEKSDCQIDWRGIRPVDCD